MTSDLMSALEVC